MTPPNFYKKLKKMIQGMTEEERIRIFNQDGLKILRKINEACDKNEKFAIITTDVDFQTLREFIKYFGVSAYFKRSYTTLFLTNFDNKIFGRIKDDRYRFLQCFYPECNEYQELVEYRDEFFKDMFK